MADRPILFSAPMVRALLDGRKTQTRRVCAWANNPNSPALSYIVACDEPGWFGDDEGEVQFFAGYAPGDRLWVREAWWIATKYSYGITPGGCELPPPPLARRRFDPVHYTADGNPPNCANRHYGPDGLRGGKSFAAPDPYAVWSAKPSIHMPRWASRLTLTVTDVRVERLQDCSEADAIAEGVSYGTFPGIWRNPSDWRRDYRSAVEAYAALWDSINGPGSWEANPWVVAVSFTVGHHNIDQVPA